MTVFGREPGPTAGASNADGLGRNRDSEPISGLIACCQRCDRLVVINTVPPDRDKLTLIAGSKRRSLLMAGDVYDEKFQHYAKNSNI